MSISIHAIIFGEDGMGIEYQDMKDDSSFPQTISMHIPFAAIANHPQVEQDLDELIQDAKVLVDSVNAARNKVGRVVREMGRQ